MGEEVGFVLYKPRLADNVGGVARALVNFGFSRLAIADPATWHFDPRSAVKAEHVLEKAYMALTLDEAIGPYAWVCGTTSRKIRRRPAISPRELGEEAARRMAAGASICVVLGSENHGLTDEDLERCDAICRIDTSLEQPSINLAQAAAILAYELRQGLKLPRPPRELAVAATREEVDRLVASTREALLGAGFLNPQQPDKILGELRRLLVRGEPTKREVELLTAAAKQVQRTVVPTPRRSE
ncbi:RNA methyltransferase [Vulgatibacter incomptus]|uniref:tRNA:Cm32/Um32 methyltransferase n=1 Tax=Vulgatibacter incomptus TaxID=1391653 RepID=A0A0K1P9D9_9BACT|nr:TrmH family RNA methyltransferase [Vulgatibacter incomptus]AKU90041.1 tRNA:Cm32/Um32 methyltransferase [Vulgatibacter incomptus]